MVERSREETFAYMDAQAENAKTELKSIQSSTGASTFESHRGLIGSWWERWFPTAGHKRLAYVLMDKPMPKKGKD